MVHLFVSPGQIENNQIHITGNDFNHVKNVLRMKVGEELSVSAGASESYLCEVQAYLEKEAVLSIQSAIQADHELPGRIVLFQGVPKSDKLELILQKAVELGAHEIWPVKMKRCIVKLEEKKEKSRNLRYQAISESAAKQSGRDLIPMVGDYITLKEALQVCQGFDHILVPYEKADGMAETKAIIDGVKPGQSVAIFIGPEGGFELSEVEEIEAAGGKAITLGKRILRTETAGLTILSVLMFHLSE